MVLVSEEVVEAVAAPVRAWEARVVAALEGAVAAREVRSPVPMAVVGRLDPQAEREELRRSSARLSCILQAPSVVFRERAMSLNFCSSKNRLRMSERSRSESRSRDSSRWGKKDFQAACCSIVRSGS